MCRGECIHYAMPLKAAFASAGSRTFFNVPFVSTTTTESLPFSLSFSLCPLSFSSLKRILFPSFSCRSSFARVLLRQPVIILRKRQTSLFPAAEEESWEDRQMFDPVVLGYHRGIRNYWREANLDFHDAKCSRADIATLFRNRCRERSWCNKKNVE